MAFIKQLKNGFVEIIDDSNGEVYARFASSPEKVNKSVDRYAKIVATRKASQNSLSSLELLDEF